MMLKLTAKELALLASLAQVIEDEFWTIELSTQQADSLRKAIDVVTFPAMRKAEWEDLLETLNSLISKVTKIDKTID